MLKKFLALGSICLMLVSCSEDNPDMPKNSVTMEYKVSCLMIPTDDSQASFPVYNVPFKFICNYDDATMSLSVSQLGISMNNKLSFETQSVSLTSLTYPDGEIFKFNVASADVKNNGTIDNRYNVSDLNCLLTNIYYCPDEWRNNNVYPLGEMVIMNCNLGNEYKLYTFPLLACYGGVTTTSFNMGGNEQRYNSDVTMYAVAIDANTSTAEVGIYNAKFAEPMPQLTMFLRGLKVEYTSDGYVIKCGEDGVVPLVGMGNAQVPYPDYVFNKFELKYNCENPTSITIDFQVAGKFNGYFGGSYTPISLD